MSNRCILIISDTHCPYHHEDLIPFLTAIKKKYKPDRVVHIGDETDKHGLNFHGQDPDLPSAGGRGRSDLTPRVRGAGTRAEGHSPSPPLSSDSLLAFSLSL